MVPRPPHYRAAKKDCRWKQWVRLRRCTVSRLRYTYGYIQLSRRLTNASITVSPLCACPIRRSATPTPCRSRSPSLLSTLAISHTLARASGGKLDALNIRVAVWGLILPVPSGSPIVITQLMRESSSGVAVYSAMAVKACI